MEGLLILVVLFIVFVPAILSIVALVKISNLRMELRRIREHVIASSPQSIPPQPLAVSETPIEKAAVPPTPPKVPSPAPAAVQDQADRSKFKSQHATMAEIFKAAGHHCCRLG